MATEPARLTLQEYLTWEVSQEIRHEYVRGLVLTMSGASRAYAKIVMNLSTLISSDSEPPLRCLRVRHEGDSAEPAVLPLPRFSGNL